MPKNESTAIAVRESGALAQFYEVLNQLPGLEEDPTPRMIQLMLNAESPAEWESVFRSKGLKESSGKRFRIHGARASESTFEESLTGWFLVCDVTDLETGERDVLTVGGDIAMAQVLNLVKTGNLPFDVQVVEKEKPTKRGYKPIHLVPLGKLVNGSRD